MTEIRFALRRLARAPGFAAAVVLVLALGVGAATAVFSLVDGIVLEPLPYPEPERLVRLSRSVGEAGAATADQSDADVLLFQGEALAFDGVGAWRFDDADLRPLEAGQSAMRVHGARVTANFFDVLGVRPALGRAFEAGEDRPGRNGVVVLSHRIWQDRLRGDPGAIGREIVLNDVPRTVVGVMPPDFAYPATEVELWLPLRLDPASPQPETFNLVGLGRMKRGVSLEAARADLARVLASAGAQQARAAPVVQPLRDSIVGPPGRVLWLLLGSVLTVLLAACTNVAGLFSLRAERAQVELAMRRALGSDLMGLLALTLSESALLCAAGGALGVLLATLGMDVARGVGATLSLPRLENVGVDTRVLAFALATTTFCALFVSVLPLLRSRSVSAARVLRGAGGGGTGTRAYQRARDAFVVAQIALALVLVAASGMVARSFVRLSQVPPGFETERVVTSRVLLPFAAYGGADERLAFFDALVRRTQAVPGVREVGLTDWVPLSGDRHDIALEVADAPAASPGGGTNHAVARVDGRYFGALGIPLVRGRTFGEPDAVPADEAIVSRAFATRYWGGASPLGKRVRPIGGRWYTVVGEVGDVHYDALGAPADEIVYFPVVMAGIGADAPAALPGALSLVVRTDAGEGEAVAAIRDIVRSLDPNVPTYDEGSMAALVERASARTRALALLLAIASVATSLLGAVGLYGSIAYSVSIRRRELGIRLALGARAAELSRMISLGGLRLAAIGVALGMAGTLATSRMLRALLYGVSPTDVLTLGLTPIVLLGIAFLASWIPARRTAGIEPAEALRSE